MPNDREQIRTIMTQSLAVLAELTSNPKPSYDIDGQKVSWNDYLKSLQATVDWCERKLAGQEPFEIQSRGMT